MVNLSTGAALDATFSALADPTRRAIVAHLARTPESPVTDLARPFAMTLPAVSKHLKVLEEAGLLARRKEGRIHHCRLVGEPMKDAAEWIERYRKFWEGRLEALEKFLTETSEEDTWRRPRRMRRARPGSGSHAVSRRRGSGSGARGPSRS